MSFESASADLAAQGFGDRVRRFAQPTDTVENAARELGTEPDTIAKTVALFTNEGPVLIVTSGCAKIHNGKFKRIFHLKARMIPWGEVEALVGHAPGGVTPFGRKEGVPCWLDVSLKRHPVVYPACGDLRSAASFTPGELLMVARAEGWIDVGKFPEEAQPSP